LANILDSNTASVDSLWKQVTVSSTKIHYSKLHNFFGVIELLLQVKGAFMNIGLKELISRGPPKGTINPTVH